jgi:hypothetical protein
LLALGVAAFGVASFAAVGREYYNEFRIPQGYGMNHLVPEELGFVLLFSAFGIVVAVSLAAALELTRVGESARRGLQQLARHPRGTAVGIALLVFLVCAALAHFVLGHAVVTDDEHVYSFIAQTLRTGALSAPPPGPPGDWPYFAEQFVVITDRGRYGKYTLGHPLVLALAQALRIEAWSGPLLTALLVGPLAYLGRRLMGARGMVLALLLFALSPQVSFTGATYLSQPTSALCLLCGLACLLAAEDRQGRALLAAAGICFGFGMTVRPLPGALFAAVACVHLLVAGRRSAGWRSALARAASFALPAALGVVAVLIQNRLQAGSPLSTGHQVAHGLEGGASGLLTIFRSHTVASTAMSVISSVVRLNVWLFGWPLSLVLCPWARRKGPWALVWAMVGAGVAYRLVAPKAGVGITGPQYLFEVVPLLCLLSADGARRLAERAYTWGSWRLDAPRVASGLMAATAVSVTLFLPSRLADLGRAGRAQNVVERLVRQRGLSQALVLHDGVVPPSTALSWAYFPRCNSPRLDDDVLFVRVQHPGGDLRPNVEFWKRRYPTRSAWYFGWSPSGPFLTELEPFLAGAPHAP